MAKQKVQFMETVLRDGQQSLIATRMPSSDICQFWIKWTRPATTHWRCGVVPRLMLACVI